MRTITQRELRNRSGEIMRALNQGESFIVTRRGVPVGELRPARRRLVSRVVLAAAFAGVPPVDSERFRRDLDDILDQSVEPRV